jgi:hypothetical protein
MWSRFQVSGAMVAVGRPTVNVAWQVLKGVRNASRSSA